MEMEVDGLCFTKMAVSDDEDSGISISVSESPAVSSKPSTRGSINGTSEETDFDDRQPATQRTEFLNDSDVLKRPGAVCHPIENEPFLTEDIIQQHRHDMYILEIESVDVVVTACPTIRAIYDGDEHQKFMERLDARIKNHDRDIERMCNYHYQGFIDSIQKLSLVRTQAEKLKATVIQTDSELEVASQTVIQKGEELVRSRKVQHNIERAIENLGHCLPVLELYAKLNQQVKEKRYYPALKTLEQLEHTFLPRVCKYRFAQMMRAAVPCFREQIKEDSMADLRGFLESVRKRSVMIGKVAMRHAAEHQNMEMAGGLGRRKKKRAAPPPPNPFTGEIDLEPEADSNVFDKDEERSAQDHVDFSPVYRCLHIYSVLGVREEFETYYRKQREEQSRLALIPPAHMGGRRQHDDGSKYNHYNSREDLDYKNYDEHANMLTADMYRNYFSGIVGFFVVEDHILNTADGLVDRPYLDEVWDKVLTNMMASLRSSYAECGDSALMLEMKSMIMLFSYTLRSYGYQVGRLSELLVDIRDRYVEILMEDWVTVFKEIFENDEYMYHPIQVSVPQQYNEVLNFFPYKDEKLQKAPCPKKFPFSLFVPKVYEKLKQFVTECLKFCDQLNLSQPEVEDMVRKSTNHLLKQNLSECLANVIEKPNLGLLQLIQVTINTLYLEDACVFLEEYISKVTESPSDYSHAARLQAQSLFKVTRKAAENKIYIKLNMKIDEFLDLADYDWLLPEPKGHASEFIRDLIVFLNTTFDGFRNLDDNVSYSACLSACAHLASKLMKMLINKSLKFLSWGALQQFNLDVIQCEHFANSEPVRGVEEGEFHLCFADLRQLLDLFMKQDWSIYFDEFGKECGLYRRVSPQSAVTLLEKIIEGEKKMVSFTVMLRKNERDKKKRLENVLKHLQQLCINGTTGIQDD